MSTTMMTKKEKKTNKKEVQDTPNMTFKSLDPFYEDLTDFEKMIWRLMKANKGVVNLISPPGFGKTAFTKAFAEKIGLKFIDLHLTTYEDNDVAGMPRVRTYNGHQVMHYAVPEWAILAQEAEHGSLTLMDEANRCKISVMNASLRVLNEKKIGYDFHFKPNDYFILTGNIGSFSKESDGAEVNVFDSAMLGRLYQVNLLTHLSAWNDHWFKVVGPSLSRPLFAYLKANPHMLHQYNEDDDGAYPSHRSNTNLSEFLKANLGEEHFNSIPHILSLKDDFSMIIGYPAALKFISYLEDMNKINGMKVLNNLDVVFDALKGYSKPQHQELLDDIKNFKFEFITKNQSDNLRQYMTYIGEELGLDEIVAGMWDFLIEYDMPDYDANEDERDQIHLLKMAEYGFITHYFKEICDKLMPDLPFEIVDDEKK